MGSHASVLWGGDLPPSRDRSLVPVLERAAAADGPGDIRCLGEDGSEVRRTYGQLGELASRALTGMRERGVAPGDPVILHVDDEPQLLTAFWACVLGGAVPVPFGTGLSGGDLGRLSGLWGGGDRVWVMTSATDRPSRMATAPASYRWLGDVEVLGQAEPTDTYHASSWDDLALLLLTSGSTGAPKAVELTHGNILSRTVAAVATDRFDEHVRSFNWMPLNHVGGLVMFHVRDVYLRCSQVHARMNWVLDDPLRWLDAMSRYRTTTTWATNSAFRLINDRIARASGRDWDLRHLGHIMNGGEPIYPGVVRRFLELLAPYGLPATAMFPGWGMSETAAGVVEHRFDPAAPGAEDRLLAVGRPHAGVGIRIVDDDDRTVSRGTVGSLQVAGDPVMRGYLREPAHGGGTFTADGWLRSGDLASIEGDTLTVVGRGKDIIRIGGTDVHAHEVEATVDDLDVTEPSYTVASPVAPVPGDAEVLAVFFHPRDPDHLAEAIAQIRDAVRSRFTINVGHVVPVAKHEVPKTEIGKLRRIHLRDRFESRWADGNDARGELVTAAAGEDAGVAGGVRGAWWS